MTLYSSLSVCPYDHVIAARVPFFDRTGGHWLWLHPTNVTAFSVDMPIFAEYTDARFNFFQAALSGRDKDSPHLVKMKPEWERGEIFSAVRHPETRLLRGPDMRPPAHCPTCQDFGGLARDMLTGRWRTGECCSCGRRGLRAEVDNRNCQEDYRAAGYQYQRLAHDVTERNIQMVWADMLRARPHVNDGRDLLTCLCGELELTDRDYKIASTVVQFMATNGAAPLRAILKGIP